jgi:hypothetical protein
LWDATVLLKVYRAYEQYKRDEALIDFDDMVHRAFTCSRATQWSGGHIETVSSTSLWTSSRTRPLPSCTTQAVVPLNSAGVSTSSPSGPDAATPSTDVSKVRGTGLLLISAC